MRFFAWLLAGAVVIALAVALAAGAQSPPNRVQQFVSAYVDRPITITCDTVPPPGGVPEGFYAEGWVYPTGSVMHLHPSVCLWLDSGNLDLFGRAFNVLAHETWHLANQDFREGCAETFARLVAFDAPRFWPLSPADMLTVADRVSDHTDPKPAAYREVGNRDCLLDILPLLEGARNGR